MNYFLIKQLAREINSAITILDTETTGFHDSRVVEFACLTIHPSGKEFYLEKMINPGSRIERAATNVHGIRNEDVKDCHNFASISDVVDDVFKNHIVSGYNTKAYDVHVLIRELRRVGKVADLPGRQIDVLNTVPWLNGKRGALGDAAKRYCVEQSGKHRAMADVMTTAALLEAIIWRHGVDHVLSKMDGPWNRNMSIVQNQDGSPPQSLKPDTKKQTAKAVVLAHIKENGRILSQDFADIASKHNYATATISYIVSDLFVRGDVNAEQVIDHAAQELIAPNLDKAIHNVGGIMRLRPLKEALESIIKTPVDYIQLRVALSQMKGMHHRSERHFTKDDESAINENGKER